MERKKEKHRKNFLNEVKRDKQNDIQYKRWLHKIIIQLQNELEITLFFKSDHFEGIAPMINLNVMRHFCWARVNTQTHIQI